MNDLRRPLRTSKYLRKAPTRTDVAFYHSLFGGLCLADGNTAGLLERFESIASPAAVFNGLGCTREKIESFVEFFKSRSLLVDLETDEYAAIQGAIQSRTAGLRQGKEVKIIQLVVSNRCNFRCRYCFTKSIYSYDERIRWQNDPENMTMHAGKAQQYIETVIEMMRKAGTPTLMIQFFGGEPLMNWPVIASVLSHFKHGENHGVRIVYSMVTNGSLFTDKIVDTLAEYGVTVLFSFDSPHGDDRVMGNGKNLNAAVERGLRLLHKAPIRLAFNAVLSKQTFPCFNTDLVDFADRYDVPEIGVILDLDPTFYAQDSADEIVDTLLSFYKYARSRGVVVTGYWHQIFQQLLDFKPFERVGFKTCSATGCQFSIEPNGAVFACKGSSGYFGHIDDMTALLSSANWEKYSLRAFRNAPECESCEIENFCSGFCLGPLEKKYHEINVIEKDTCVVYKKLVKGLIHEIRKYEVDTWCLL